MDTGATYTYISKQFVQHHGFATTSCAPHTVTAASGQARISQQVQGKLCVGTHVSNVRPFVMPLELPHVDIILGNDWLRQHNATLRVAQRTCTLSSGRTRHTIAVPHHPAALPDIAAVAHCLRECAPDPARFLLSSKSANKLLRQGVRHFAALVQLEPADAADGAPQPHVCAIQPQPNTPPAVVRLLDEFADVFADTPPGLPPDRNVRHVIRTNPHATPPFRRQYRLTQAERDEVIRQIKELLRMGLIEPSVSPYGAPILFVEKKDGSLRMCIDYRMLNQITVPDRYPLPRIDDLFDKLHGKAFFSSLDLQCSYNQVRIPPEDVPKTAFLTPLGQYQFKVLCFGLSNAPATFQRVMDDVFRELMVRNTVLVYLDDILVMSRTLDEHVTHLREVLTLLREHRLYAKFSKCSFAQTHTKFLGHIVSAEGLQVDPDKTSVVRDWPHPKNVSELRSFLGLASYFRRFIRGFSQLASPLTDLTKDVPFDFAHWPPGPESVAFEGVKQALTNPPVLALPDFTKPFQVRVDASISGTGGVLMQEGRPIAYTSSKFSPAERNYTTFDQEMLALVHACAKWRCYLHGRPFQLVTDHKPLLHLPKKEDLTRRQVRAITFLSDFEYTIIHEPGKGNVADPLSRHPSLAVVTRNQARQQAAGTSNAPAPPPAPVRAPQPAPALPSLPPSTQTMLPPPPAHPTSIRQQILRTYATDPSLSGMLHNLDKGDDGYYYSNGKVYVPNDSQLRQLIMHECHDATYAGHVGVQKTLERVSRWYWWPGVRRDVYQHVVHCDTCQRNKSSSRAPAGLLQPLPVPGFRWQTCTMDLIVKLPPTNTTPPYDSIVVFVDKLSKMVHMAPCRESMNAMEFADLFLANVFRLHGLPDSFVSDRGTQFNNDFFNALCHRLQVRHHMSTAYHPQSNGQTERTNRTIEDMLRHFVSPTQHDWHKHLPLIEFAINSSYNESTQSTPFYLMYGCHPMTPLLRDAKHKSDSAADATALTWQQTIDRARTCLEAARQRMQAYANRSRRDVSYKPGELVLLWTGNLRLRLPGIKKLHPKYVGPFTVARMVGSAAVQLVLPEVWARVHPVFHVALVKKYWPDKRLTHFQPPESVRDTVKEFEVKEILDHRGTKKRATKFMVSYHNLGVQHNRWVSKSALSEYKHLLRAYKVAKGLSLTDSDAESGADA
jgi:hypothetical protein